MSDLVKIIECPRDAWQGLPQIIPAHVKADYIRSLFRAGFRHVDAVSFVSPSAVPQMADSDEVMQELSEENNPLPADADILAIVVNERGVDRALASDLVTTLGFPYSISPTFLLRNQKQTPEQAVDQLDIVLQKASENGLGACAYVSMAFGNPYGDPWSIEEVIAACELLVDIGVEQISLADTVGIADAEAVRRLTAEILAADVGAEIGVHLHARPDEAAPKVLAAYASGCRRFDMAIAGLGGCPFAQDALIGNIVTERALAALREAGAELPPISSLETLVRASEGIAARFGAPATVH